jgi:hypothetical protein
MKLKRKQEAPSGRRRQINDNKSLQSSQTSYSYRSRRSEEDYNVGRKNGAKQKLAQTTRHSTRKFGLIILLLAIIVSAIRVLSLSSTPVVKFVGSNSNNALTSKNGTSVYEQAASAYLSSSIWNKDKLTLDSNGLTNYLKRTYPELSDVSISIPFVDNHLVIYLTPMRPAIVLVEPTAAYALDPNGQAILKAPNAQSLNLNLPIVTDQSGLNVALGKMAITSSDVYFIEEVAGQLNAKSYSVSAMTLPANSDELDVSLAGQPYFVKFNLNSGDARQQAGTFLATIANLKSQNITPAKYVDVRVDGRAYYQ